MVHWRKDFIQVKGIFLVLKKFDTFIIHAYISHSSLFPFNINVKAKTIEEICGYENLMYSEKQVKGKCSE